MRNYLIAALIASTTIFFIACGGGSSTTDKPTAPDANSTPTAESGSKPAGDDKLGVGKFTNVPLSTPCDVDKVTNGQKVYDVKCSSCHKLTDEKLVGPGWKGVTTRRTPEWIMNFATNTDEMLDKDAAALSMLEICLVKMPNQHLADEEARAVLEFMRSNDGVK